MVIPRDEKATTMMMMMMMMMMMVLAVLQVDLSRMLLLATRHIKSLPLGLASHKFHYDN